jgi:GntR family transcriptional repressor for pyruvate dehydrogenase complex
MDILEAPSAVFEERDVTTTAAKRQRRIHREKPQQIADELRSLIVSGELAEGDSLGREPELVERFGVSRPSLREALRILKTEGLVEVVRGLRGGVVVREPSQRMTARTAALILQALIDQQEEAILDPEAFAGANARLHERLVSLAGNQTLTIVEEMLNEIVVRAVMAVCLTEEMVGSVSTRH